MHRSLKLQKFVHQRAEFLFRGAGLDVVWSQFLALAVIGIIMFGISLARFRSTIGTMV